MKPVLIFGSGDFAQVASVYLRHDSPREVAGFTVHERHRTDTRLLELDVVPFESIATTHPPSAVAMFVAVGYRKLNAAREEIYGECKRMGYELITYVSSRACVFPEAHVGENSFVFEQNVIQPFAQVGDNVVMWSGNHVGHHSRIGDHCFVASHAVISGRVSIGHHTFVGVNATIRDGVTIGARNVIGAGAVITKDTGEGEVYAPDGTAVSRVPSSRLAGFK
jgi:sugar O-acyltransferase (sialic acid O-acetyltransferase NeuD family)